VVRLWKPAEVVEEEQMVLLVSLHHRPSLSARDQCIDRHCKNRPPPWGPVMTMKRTKKKMMEGGRLLLVCVIEMLLFRLE
jgi:hypothetical protein